MAVCPGFYPKTLEFAHETIVPRKYVELSGGRCHCSFWGRSVPMIYELGIPSQTLPEL